MLNPEDLGEQYIEDCQVCCRPIEFLITQAGDGELTAMVSSDAETKPLVGSLRDGVHGRGARGGDHSGHLASPAEGK